MIKHLALAALVASALVFTPTGSHAAEVKIGGVSLQSVFDNSSAGKAMQKKFQERLDKERVIIEGKKKEIEKRLTELEQQRMMMRPETVSEKERELQRLKREFDLYQEDTRSSLQREQGAATRKLINDILAVVKAVGKEKGYTAILEKGSGASLVGPMVLYMDEAADLTAEVIKRFDAASK